MEGDKYSSSDDMRQFGDTPWDTEHSEGKSNDYDGDWTDLSAQNDS